MSLNLLAPDQCHFDCVALGEVMLRLDPGEGRIRRTRSFEAWEGGGEYNVARGLRRCFGLRTAVVTSLVDNEVGRLVEDLMLQGGVDLSYLQWQADDGIGRRVRNGLNFTERGFGVRGALGVSDRGHTAVSQLTVGSVDWDSLFGLRKTRWFHTGGIFASLSDSTAEVAIEACKKASANGAIVSYDLNYRPSLWKDRGGIDRAREVNRQLAPLVDVMIGNEEDFSVGLGIEVGGASELLEGDGDFARMVDAATAEFPNFKLVGTTLRSVKSATVNDWSAICWYDGAIYRSNKYPALEIFDRVGGGDSFASGLIYGLLSGQSPQAAVNLGAAHGALAMTTPGDNSMASLAEVTKLAAGGNARVVR
ncbi:PfkB family carbohydrate kinase [Lacipirellula sp.]|uniref:PfkB family carbohydrate kinase n=1 Tax=Lacipirellula sp. TaxID=2691419 RepID=UPI003D12D447